MSPPFARPQLGLSRNRVRMAVGCEQRRGGLSVFRRRGLGKPGGARAASACGPHVERGPLPVHGMGDAHDRLAGEPSLESESHNSKEIARLPDWDNPPKAVSYPCLLAKELLHRHSGLGCDDTDGWPDLLSVLMSPHEDKMGKVAMVLDREHTLPLE